MIRNFLFHRVHPERNDLWDPMDPILFEKCIQYITKKYEVILFEDLVNSPKLNAKNNIASIMFDDGYLDNFEFAAPILDKYNCKASFYVVTDCIDKNILTWTHQLEHIFIHTDKDLININFEFLPDEFKVKKLVSREEKLKYIRKIMPILKSLRHKDRKQFIDYIIEVAYDIKFPKLMMNWDHLRNLTKRGHYVSSHTVTHVMLGTIDDESLLRYELKRSAERIEKELGYFPKTISYPVGSYNELVKNISKEIGYEIGLAVGQDCYDAKKQDIFEVKRIELYNEPWWKVKLRISNRLEQIKKIIRYK